MRGCAGKREWIVPVCLGQGWVDKEQHRLRALPERCEWGCTVEHQWLVHGCLSKGEAGAAAHESSA
eukprot:1159745-Pelagomonas_calceolata.AAC.5